MGYTLLMMICLLAGIVARPHHLVLAFRTGGVPGIKLRTVNVHKDHADVPEFNSIIGGEIALPCNVTPPTPDDSISLILWYRGESGNPIYSVDARSGFADKAKHFASDTLGSRAYFNMTNRWAELRLDPVKEEDGGEYRCRVDFKRARTQNRILRLNVIVPPKEVMIVDENGERLPDLIGPFNEGSSLNFTCESRGGKPEPSVTWWRGPVLLDDTSTIMENGKVRNVLFLQSLERKDLMTVFTCQASNSNLTLPVSTSITIDLNLKPTDVRILTSRRPLSAGQRVELVCQSSGSRPSATISWWKDDEKLSHVGESTNEDDGITTSYLTYIPSVEDQGKTLTCSASNPEFSGDVLTDNWTLSINYPPILTIAMGANVQRQDIVEGSDVIFDCNIQANPPVSEVGWKFEGRDIITNEDAGISITNNSLILKSVGRDHRGHYQCVAANSEGVGESERVLLKILFAPVCKGGQKLYYGVARHEAAKVSCEVEADPPSVYFQWAFNNSLEGFDIAAFVSDGKRSVATYVPRSKADYGSLHCWAKNSVGMQKEACVFYVIPAGPPDPVTNCSVVNQTDHAIFVECDPGDNGGLEQTFHLEAYSSLSQRLLNNVTSAGSPVFRAHSLPAGNSFILVIYSSNAKGRSGSVKLKASTLFSAQRLPDDMETVVISPVLGVLIGVVGALVLLAIIIILIMKVKSEDDSREVEEKSNSDEKISTVIVKEENVNDVEDKCPDVIPPRNFQSETEYADVMINNTNKKSGYIAERIYENLQPSEDRMYENVRTQQGRTKIRFKDEDLTYAELALPNNQRPFRKAEDSHTEYADIDFQRSRKVRRPSCGNADAEEDDIGATAETPLMHQKRPEVKWTNIENDPCVTSTPV